MDTKGSKLGERNQYPGSRRSHKKTRDFAVGLLVSNDWLVLRLKTANLIKSQFRIL